jgi:Domain of unknown function (DUF4262)
LAGVSQRRHTPTVLDDPRDGFSEDERKVIEDVEEFGFHWISVGQSEQDALDSPEWRDVPGWSYTIGLYARCAHPELVVFTLDNEIVGALFWDLARQIAAGRKLEAGEVYEDALPSFDGQTCSFELVSSGWAPELFGWAEWFYKGARFPVLQYLWPDRHGKFATDDDVLAAVRESQPTLVEAPAYEGAPPPPR